jgi:ABC-type dipeptide/oligopeptide/nickel transport system permease subunit
VPSAAYPPGFSITQLSSFFTNSRSVPSPWIAIFPGLAIALMVFGFSLFGDALRDALDPKHQ